MRTVYVYCEEQKKMVVKAERKKTYTHHILGDIKSFKSPIDGRIISDRSHLRDHNSQHGVTDIRDYGDKWFKTKAKERERDLHGTTPAAKKERRESIERAFYNNGKD